VDFPFMASLENVVATPSQSKINMTTNEITPGGDLKKCLALNNILEMLIFLLFSVEL